MKNIVEEMKKELNIQPVTITKITEKTEEEKNEEQFEKFITDLLADN